MAFGSVPKCGVSCGRSTGLLISEGTDSVLLILATKDDMVNITHALGNKDCTRPLQTERGRKKQNLLGRKEILQDGASFVHLLWHFNLHEEGGHT